MSKLKIVLAIGTALVLMFSSVAGASADEGDMNHGHDNSCCHGDE